MGSLNIFEDETITVYTFSIVALGLFGDKCSSKSDIRPFPDYAKWHNNSLRPGLGYIIDIMLNPFHQDIMMIIAVQYQHYPPLWVLATEMTLKAVKFISDIDRWIDDTYELLLMGGNIKGYVWWITTQGIRSIFEDYLAQARYTSSKTSFGSYHQRRRNLIYGVIKGHLAANKMFEKSIK